jgi:4-carboxymuconolactone decarboxylase
MADGTDAYALGWERLVELAGEDAAHQLLAGLSGIAPDAGRYIVEFLFGEIYQRGGLDLRDRQLVQVAMFTTLGGCEPQLQFHTRAALNAGLAASEIVEAILQCAPYAGFPRALNALYAVKAVFDEHGIVLEGA